MPVIAVVNRKGGCGKSTLATHLAAWLAGQGHAVMLGDVDRQQSTQGWLRARAEHALPGAPIVGWAVDPRRVLRPPSGIGFVVLDTPGGLHGFDLARVAAFADVILMPVSQSRFDRESAADCHAELAALPRVAGGRCKVAAIGMRLDARTRAAQALADWARDLGLPFIGALREAQVYVRCIERGLTLFDLPAEQTASDRAQWQTIFDWLEPALRAVPRPEIRANARVLRPASHESNGAAIDAGLASRSVAPAPPATSIARRSMAAATGRAPAAGIARWLGRLGWLSVAPGFLNRHS